MEPAEAILIDEADLPSLVAASLRPQPGLVLVHARRGDDAAARRAKIIAEHETALGASTVFLDHAASVAGRHRPRMDSPAGRHRPRIDSPNVWPTAVGTTLHGSLVETLVLVEAATLAATLGATRVIWPRQVGPDPSLVEVALERATLAAALAGSTSGCVPPAMETPLLDLTDEQVVDLAEDAGVPARAFWPCVSASREPCGSCPGCGRWQKAYAAQGVPWPWSAAGVKG
jgi:hypothetical protein